MSTNDTVKTDDQVAEELPKVETHLEVEPTPVDAAAEEGEREASVYTDFDDEDVESEDSLTFSNGVIEKIVALAMRDVPGVVGMKGGFINRVQDAFGVRDARRGVTVEVTPDSAVRVNVAVFIAYGSYAPQVFEDVKHAVVDAVSGMTGLEVAGVNLRIEDVLTEEEIEARLPKASDVVSADEIDQSQDVLFDNRTSAEPDTDKKAEEAKE
ncbi:MAG: Asp23/Gls24 family envelope stress response protein [Atopobiaceae bacterium]|nr:Asp23/Gls24 family envelope stress response protein [Atopobiaceae bacterium]